jgi:exosortase/archaeosortase family protein
MFKSIHTLFGDILSLTGIKKQGVPSFALRFGVWCSVGIFLLNFDPLNPAVQSMVNILAWLTGWCLNLTGLPVFVAGHKVILPEIFSIDITLECSGLPHLIVFLSGVISYPANRNSRVLGIVMATTIIFTGNLLRIVTLFLTGVFARDFFEIAHTLIWGGISIAGIILLWLLWIHLVAIPNRYESAQAK